MYDSSSPLPSNASPNMEMNLSATACASSLYPLLNAGCPQQVCPGGNSTSTPSLSRTLTIPSPTPGKKVSTRHVTKR